MYRRKTPGVSGSKKILEVNLPESSRIFITCIRKYLLFYLKLLEEAGDTCTLERAYVSLRVDKRVTIQSPILCISQCFANILNNCSTYLQNIYFWLFLCLNHIYGSLLINKLQGTQSCLSNVFYAFSSRCALKILFH